MVSGGICEDGWGVVWCAISLTTLCGGCGHALCCVLWCGICESVRCSVHASPQGSGTLFSFGPIFFPRFFVTPVAGLFGHFPHIIFPCVADIMWQRPIHRSFGTAVQPCPRAKRDDVITTILYFPFQDGWSGKKRQEAYNAAQKACSTLFLTTPMATLCEFVRQGAITARQDRGLICDEESDENARSSAFPVCVA